jgi:hypothetical protein
MINLMWLIIQFNPARRFPLFITIKARSLGGAVANIYFAPSNKMTNDYDVIDNCPFNCCSWCATFPLSPFSLQWRHCDVTWPMTSLSWLIMTSSIVIHQWLSVLSVIWLHSHIYMMNHVEWRNRWMTSSLMSHSDVIRTTWVIHEANN